MIQYKSTRGGDHLRTAASAVIKGIAEDRGLFVPDSIPALPFRPGEMVGRPYKEVAKAVIGAFFTDYTEEEIQACVDGAYDEKFEAEDIVPVVGAGDAFFLELYHGKTAAFKDMALSILPYLLTTAMKKEKEEKKIAILTATSGDTGKAALEGFADVPGTEIIVFYPSDGVSEVQKRQMTTQEGANTHVFGIRGNFDDAQTGVKQIFDDEAFNAALEQRGFRLSSANSINIGRLVPQVAYYVYGYIKLIEQGVIREGDPVNIVVPTGNFGNILASYYAGRMGIPVNRFICASNTNKVLTDFINTGEYNTGRPFHVTYSPSMDILISSNLERLLYHLSGSPEEVRKMMEKLAQEGHYSVSGAVREGMKPFWGGFADDEETLESVRGMYREHGYLMDTHTAVAYKVYEDYRAETGDLTPTLLASTASAYKFASSVNRALEMPEEADGFACVRALETETGVKVPSGLKDLDQKAVRHPAVIEKTALRQAIEDSLK
ncbi:MAG: threonine synthase [Firmicutes bacterium]|nr:threonine synthase [Bacillota bacterium]